MRGVLFFLTETGMEGGRWTFLNEDDVPKMLCQDTSHNYGYDEMHILKDGDKLTVFDKNDPTKIIWKGVVSLKQYPIFTQEIFGFWIHADQKGVDRKTWAEWFFGEFPAELFPATENKK